jgi:hypothetical protein
VWDPFIDNGSQYQNAANANRSQWQGANSPNFLVLGGSTD